MGHVMLPGVGLVSVLKLRFSFDVDLDVVYTRIS